MLHSNLTLTFPSSQQQQHPPQLPDAIEPLNNRHHAFSVQSLLRPCLATPYADFCRLKAKEKRDITLNLYPKGYTPPHLFYFLETDSDEDRIQDDNEDPV